MIQNEILVSIIVPVYGTESYLPACIDSLCKQTYPHIQIILIDDQSPDGCPMICDNYSRMDTRITVIHQKNKGVSGARNTGLQYAMGEYVMFVDSDDELHPEAVNILLRDSLMYSSDIAWAPRKPVDASGKLPKGYEEGTYTIFRGDDAILLSLNGEHNINAVWSKLFKRSFINGIFFEEGKHINEDGFFMFQCYLRKPILVRHNISLYQYNTRQSSCSRQFFSDKYFSMLYFCNRKIELVKEYCPQYIEHVYNMEVRTHLLFLQVLCRTNEKKYKDVHKESVKIVRNLYRYHKPIHDHHKKLAWIVSHGLYPVYKTLIRIKHYR